MPSIMTVSYTHLDVYKRQVCALGMVGEGTDYSDLVINMDNNFGQQEYGIAFRKGSDVTEKVNEAIKELYEDGTVDTIAKKYGLQEMLIK